MKLIDGQMMLELFPKHEPGNCSDEGSVVDIIAENAGAASTRGSVMRNESRVRAIPRQAS